MRRPTLVLPLSHLGRSLVRQALPFWPQRLEEGTWAVAEWEAWRPALQGLLALPKFLALKRRGTALDFGLHVVVLAEASEEGLPPLVADLEAAFLRGEYRDQEVWLHLVLFLRGPEDLEGLKRFAPDPTYPLACRVWPVSRWSTNGLYLPKDEFLALWVQHFVEALVRSGAPLAPQRGRDWVGLGIARLDWAKPNSEALALRLWEEIQNVQLASPPQVPDLPPCPPLDLSRAPKLPERTDCRTFPEWQEGRWEAFRKEVALQGEASLEPVLAALEARYPFEIGRQALLLGLPALRESERLLDEALSRIGAEWDALLSELDRVAGLEGRRARLARLEARAAQGRPVDAEEMARHREALAELDQALAEGDLSLFLEKDEAAQQARERLGWLKDRYLDLREKWSRMEQAPPATPPSFWAKVRALLRRLFGKREAHQGETLTRKDLCDLGWRVLRESHEANEAHTQRFLHYLEHWRRMLLLRHYREALAREKEGVAQALGWVGRLDLTPRPQDENPLELRVQARGVPRHKIQEAAKALVQAGALEAFWDGDVESVRHAFLEEARRLAEATPVEPLAEVPEEVWDALVVAASPRVRLMNWPEHRRYAYVLGSVQRRRWGEPYGEESWFPEEIILLRMVYPLAPDHLADVSLWEAPLEDSQGEEQRSDRRQSDVIRGNPLLDELLREV